MYFLISRIYGLHIIREVSQIKVRHNERVEERIQEKRYKAIKLYYRIRDVDAVCERCGMSRTTFYKWKNKYESSGMSGLQNSKPVPKSNPRTPTIKIKNKIIDYSLQNPEWGCVKLSSFLKIIGIKLSSPTVQKVLIECDMASRIDRWGHLEDKAASGNILLTDYQIHMIKKINPCLRENAWKPRCSGDLLFQDVIRVGSKQPKSEPFYIQVVIDAYSSYSFALICSSLDQLYSIKLLQKKVLPFFQGYNRQVSKIFTDNGKPFTKRGKGEYNRFLTVNDIKHNLIGRGRLKTNGYVERFINTIKREFSGFKRYSYGLIDQSGFTSEFHEYLYDYNNKPHRGYPNYGKSPVNRIRRYRKNG